jgi:hypothetical protein
MWKRDGMIVLNGTHYCYKNGDLHREDGPAIIWLSGTEEWYLNGRLHRKGGPAITTGIKWEEEWWLNGYRHREDGPALYGHNYQGIYFLEGEMIRMSSFKPKKKTTMEEAIKN